MGSALIAGTTGACVNVIRNYGENGNIGSLGSNLYAFAANAFVGAYGGSAMAKSFKSIGVHSVTTQWGALATAGYSSTHDFIQSNFPKDFAVVGSGGNGLDYTVYVGDNSSINEHSRFVLVNGVLMADGGTSIPVYTEDEVRMRLSVAAENERLNEAIAEMVNQEVYTPEIKTDFSDMIPNIDMTPYEYTPPDYLQNLPTIKDIPQYEMPPILLYNDPFNTNAALQNKINDIDNWINGLLNGI